MEININDNEEIFILPDGSLFFLSSRLEDTALYNCGYKEKNGNIVTSRPGAITVVIIAGAAVIFMKIKNLSIEQNADDPNINEKELQKLVKSESQLPTILPYFQSADVNHYETPLQFQQKVAADL